MRDRMNSPWRKSSYSGSGGGECVEVGAGTSVFVRDSRDHAGAVLSFTADAWSAFVGSIR
jgi:uncharacterized protein DUF397